MPSLSDLDAAYEAAELEVQEARSVWAAADAALKLAIAKRDDARFAYLNAKGETSPKSYRPWRVRYEFNEKSEVIDRDTGKVVKQFGKSPGEYTKMTNYASRLNRQNMRDERADGDA